MSGTAPAADPHQAALLKLFNELWVDPDVGESVRRRAKTIRPEISIPDDHPVAAGVRRELAVERAAREALQKQIDDDRTARQAEAAEAKLRGDLGRAQTRFKLTDQGLQDTMRLMQERQIADAEAAAALYVENLPKAAPSSPANNLMPGKFNLFGTTARDDRWEKLHTDEAGYFADVVNEVFAEFSSAA